MNVGNALKVTCLGIAGGVVLRLLNMLYFFDYTTGFYTDGGLLAWIGMGFIILISIVSIVMCKKEKRVYTEYIPRKNIFAGIVSIAAGALLLYMSYAQYNEKEKLEALGYSGRNYSQISGIHTVLIVASILLGIIFFFTSATFFSGKNLFLKARALTLIPVAWGMIYVTFVFVYYTISSSTIENMYVMLGGASMLLSLFYIGKLLAGFDGSAARRCFMCGIPAVILLITYTLSNLILSLLNKTYMDFTEMPLAIQLGVLGIALFILAFLFTYKKYGMAKRPELKTGTPSKRGGAMHFKN